MIYLAVIVGAAVVLVGWAAVRARGGGVVEDPHRVAATPPAAAPAPGGAPAAPEQIEILLDYLLGRARVELGIDLEGDPLAKQRLTEAARGVAQQPGRTAIRINIPFITADASGPKHLDLELLGEELDVLLGKRAR